MSVVLNFSGRGENSSVDVIYCQMHVFKLDLFHILVATEKLEGSSVLCQCCPRQQGTMDYLRPTAGREVQGLQAAQALIVSTLDKNKHETLVERLSDVSLSLILAADLSSGPEQTFAVTIHSSD